MRFVTFEEGGRERAGVLLLPAGTDPGGADLLADLAHPDLADCLGDVPPDLLAMITAGLGPIAERLTARFSERPGAGVLGPVATQNVRLLAPLPAPPRIIGAAHNYVCAMRERGLPPPDAPVLFEKSPATVVGPDAPVILPAGAGGITYEAEFAAVIGRRAEAVTAEDALSHVAGYTLFNDVSASEIIRADGGFERGKNFPTFGPMGPWLATADTFDPTQGQRVTLSVDGTIRQDGTVSDLLFGVAELIVHLSRDVALEPGTVIATGTPAGVAPVQTPPTWLQPDCEMITAIEGLGQLRNPVQNEVPTDAR
ncbi:fumarylacetoacetate hydrolase family protein [Roseivivax sediminis]|uniref:2-keto-4-pentenoate hydratase/2-oxohepta-3-ene-1,7-dioic acid hydratase (Catechol pathway) n=1 Tax=Roseivivax sediminis TaxID=936889 RepID=A0A1I2EKY8_9RHOB|nr:fumarylacetoacetate hydrolase family protein [Roseivivax sediminis]SFE93176.1 2-keto-4-pentenoate hydratase/2-oxohepta-3-ene-1,7-dioic acid hydratase (catechol pathway) [Roseivivax sediminis]